MAWPIAVVAILIASCLGSRSLGQGTADDYARAASLEHRFGGKVHRGEVEPHWLDGHRLWYSVECGSGPRDYVLVDAATGERRPLFDAVALGRVLVRRTRGGEGRDGKAPAIERLEVLPDTSLLLLVEGIDVPLTFAPASGALADASAELAATFTLALGPEPSRARRSRNGGRSTGLRFVNRSSGPVDVVWLDNDGAERRYATVAAGATHAQHTFSGHLWKVTDAAGRTLGFARGVDEPALVVVPADATPVADPSPAGTRPGDSPSARPRRSRSLAPGLGPAADLPSHIDREPEQADSVEFAADGHRERLDEPRAEFEQFNLVVRDASGSVILRTEDGSESNAYAAPAYWSPDRTKLLVMRSTKPESHLVHLVESRPREQVQPKLHSFEYQKPGDRVAEPQPRLFDLARRAEVPLSGTLPAHPWALDHVRWRPDSSRVDLLDNERGHQVMRLLSIDASSGVATPIIEERCPTFFDYAGKLYLEHLDDTDEVIWMSERSGWNHLYLIDRATGAVKHPITSGPWVVRGVERVDQGRREAVLRVGGIHPDQDPYHEHWVRVSLDGGGPVLLTTGDGTHHLRFSPDGSHFIDTWSRVDTASVCELRRSADGSLVTELERADIGELLAAGWQAPERIVAKGRDGATDIWGVLWKPTTFDPSDSYPVIECIYAGPQDSFVPKSFQSTFSQQRLAELGFIVVQIDGMGTSNRSKAFHDVCWKNLKDAGFPDRVAWLRHAAASRPWMDLTRVGIYGGSAGGQNALRGMLDFPEVYKACVADCGCHDNRMDKIWWNELWMGWPVDESYAASSNVVDAHRLQGQLLLIVGELDRNVDPASTMQVVDALVRADKDFELLVLPGVGHGAAETPYGSRRRADFFVRHLLGVEPRRRSPETPTPAH